MPAGFGGGNRNGGGADRPRGQGDSTRRRERGADQQGGGNNGANNGGMRGNPEMRAINEQLRPLYEKIGVDARTAGACSPRTTRSAGWW